MKANLTDTETVKRQRYLKGFAMASRSFLAIYLGISLARGILTHLGWFEPSVYFNGWVFFIAFVLFIISFGAAEVDICPNCGSLDNKNEYFTYDRTEVSHVNYDGDGNKTGHTERILGTDTGSFNRCMNCDLKW